MRRQLLRLAVIAVLASLTVVGACSRKKPEVAGDGPGGGYASAPASVATEHFVIAHYRVSEVRQSALYKELIDGIFKTGELGSTWDEFEKTVEKLTGAKIAFGETLIFCWPDAPNHDRDLKRFVLITQWDRPIPPDSFIRKHVRPAADQPGFHRVEDLLVHFPDEKTVVFLHTDFAARYRAGYAKDRKAWPMTEEFLQAAEQHTLFAAGNPGKLPPGVRNEREMRPFAGLLDAKSVTLAVDLRGKEFRVGLRGAFADNAAAEKGKEAVAKIVAELAREVGRVASDPSNEELGALLAPVKEARRALDEAKIETSGSDLTATTLYKADFDMSAIVASAVDRVRGSANRMQGQGNLKQIGIAMHNYQDVYQKLPISGIDAMGPIRDPKGKPLLSWRVAILPFIEQEPLFREFKLNEPWDSEHNKKLIDKMPKIYAPVNNAKAPAGQTFYQQVIGPAAMRPHFRIETILDGTANTIAVVEAAEPVIWTKPDDVFIPTALGKGTPPDLKKKFGGIFKSGFNALLWDGSVRWIDARISDTTLWALLTPDGNEVIGGDW